MGLIKKPNELTVKNALSALIYGQPGMGKTTLALSSPQPLLLDFDGGVHRVNAAHRVDTVQISKWEEVDEVLTSGEIAEYKTIVIDTAGKMLSFMDKYIGEFYQFNLSSCIRQQNSLTAQFVSFSLSNLANIFYPPQFLQ